MGDTARRAAVATLVVIGLVVVTLALWKIRVVIALFLLGMVVAAAIRPGVDWLNHRWRWPRPLGVLVHYTGLAAALGIFLWLVLPAALTQLQHAIGQVPTSTAELHRAAQHSTGIRHTILVAVQTRLQNVPSGSGLVHPAMTVTKKAFEVLVGIVFMFAVGAYWIFERDRAIALVASLVPRRHRRVIRDTWLLVDHKLGAFVRGQLILVAFVAVLLSLAFWLDGLPYWLLLGPFAGRGRDRADRRPARGRHGRGRRRSDRELAGRARRGHRRAGPAPARGLRDHAACAWGTRSACRRSSCSSR